MKPALLVATLALGASAAHAEPCRQLDDATAERVARTLAGPLEVIVFCEPCGDAVPGVPQRASADSLRVHGDGAELLVDGAPVDVAHVYVKTDARTFHNLAALVGCPAAGVSPTLAITAETADGVLIRASNHPPPTPPLAADAPAAPTVLVLPVRLDTPLPWWLLASTGLGGASLGALAALAAVARRRRRPLRPRALELLDRHAGER